MTSHTSTLSPGGTGQQTAQSLYRDALACVERAELRRAQTKLRLALAYDPFFDPARRELDRLVL